MPNPGYIVAEKYKLRNLPFIAGLFNVDELKKNVYDKITLAERMKSE